MISVARASQTGLAHSGLLVCSLSIPARILHGTSLIGDHICICLLDTVDIYIVVNVERCCNVAGVCVCMFCRVMCDTFTVSPYFYILLLGTY